MRQQLIDPARWPRWQPGQLVLEVAVRVERIQVRRVQQAHQRNGASIRASRRGEQPVRVSDGNESSPGSEVGCRRPVANDFHGLSASARFHFDAALECGYTAVGAGTNSNVILAHLFQLDIVVVDYSKNQNRITTR